jgi:hypothetical protein
MKAALAGAILFVLLLLPAAADAQEPQAESAVSVYATLGMGRFNSEGNRGNGPDLGGGLAYAINPRFAVSVDIDYWRHKRELGPDSTHEGSGLFATGNLVVYLFPEHRHQLYLLGGAGVGRYHRRDLLERDVPP